MATSLPRVQVTQSPALRDAIARAERRWPGVSRSELLARLALLGDAGLETTSRGRAADRRRALLDTQGSFSYPEGHLDELRAEWR